MSLIISYLYHFTVCSSIHARNAIFNECRLGKPIKSTNRKMKAPTKIWGAWNRFHSIQSQLLGIPPIGKSRIEAKKMTNEKWYCTNVCAHADGFHCNANNRKTRIDFSHEQINQWQKIVSFHTFFEELAINTFNATSFFRPFFSFIQFIWEHISMNYFLWWKMGCVRNSSFNWKRSVARTFNWKLLL